MLALYTACFMLFQLTGLVPIWALLCFVQKPDRLLYVEATQN